MVHQCTASQNVSAQPAVCVVSNFSHGEACVQQWAIVTQTITTFMRTVSTGGIGHDHELHPKQPLDHEAVEAVSRQRERIIRAGADTEVPLPFAQDPDQASTAAPPDDEQVLFEREEALRMDEEIMDFQWFDNVSWDNIKDPRGTTYVQPPSRYKFAPKQAKHAILRAIMHNNPSTLATEPAWKALMLSSWLLLGRPAENAVERKCAHYMEARLDLF